MRIRVASLLLALALPAMAQDGAPTANEVLFFKAFYLDKGERDFPAAMSLYEKFLAAEPNHRFARVAAQNNLVILQYSGMEKEAQEFEKKYSGLLGGVAAPAPERPAGDAPRGQRGEGQRGQRGEGQRGQRGPRLTPEQQAERIKGLKDELAKAKEAGDTEEVARLENQIRRLEQGGQGGPGQGGQGQRGQGGRRGGMQVKFAEMSKEQIDEFKATRLEGMTQWVERTRERQGEEAAKKLEDGIAAVKKALDENKLDEAQQAYDKMMEGMFPGRGRRGGGGGI